MDFYDYIWKDCPDNGRSTRSYIIFYQGGTIHHGTHVPGPVAKSSAESEYNAACTTGMASSNSRMLFHGFLNKGTDIVPDEAPLIVLDIKYAMCMANNGKDKKHTRNIARIMNFLRNGEIFNINNIYWYEGGL